MSETTGQRLFQIRLACGDGVRKAESLEAFAERVNATAGTDYDKSTISLLERMKQKWRLDDINAFIAVDPKGRTAAWLAFGDQGAVLLDPSKDRGLTEEEERRAVEAAAHERSAQTTRGKSGGKGKA